MKTGDKHETYVVDFDDGDCDLAVPDLDFQYTSAKHDELKVPGDVTEKHRRRWNMETKGLPGWAKQQYHFKASTPVVYRPGRMPLSHELVAVGRVDFKGTPENYQLMPKNEDLEGENLSRQILHKAAKPYKAPFVATFRQTLPQTYKPHSDSQASLTTTSQAGELSRMASWCELDSTASSHGAYQRKNMSLSLNGRERSVTAPGSRPTNNFMSLGVDHKHLLEIRGQETWAVVGPTRDHDAQAFRVCAYLKEQGAKRVIHVNPDNTQSQQDRNRRGHQQNLSLLEVREPVDVVCLCVNPHPHGMAIVEQMVSLGIKQLFIQNNYHCDHTKLGRQAQTFGVQNGVQIHRSNILLQGVATSKVNHI